MPVFISAAMRQTAPAFGTCMLRAAHYTVRHLADGAACTLQAVIAAEFANGAINAGSVCQLANYLFPQVRTQS